MIIRGELSFDKAPGKLPKPSCLNFIFEDISFQDVKSVLYAEKRIDVSGVDMKKKIKYSLETKKPKDIKADFTMSVVLNIGWCPDKNSTSWLRNHDFLSDTTFRVPLSLEEVEYSKDIAAVYYCKFIFRSFHPVFCDPVNQLQFQRRT